MTGSFVLALLSKEQAVTLPLLAVIYEHFYRGDRLETTRWQKLLRYGPLWLVMRGLRLCCASNLWGRLRTPRECTRSIRGRRSSPPWRS